MFDPSGIGNAGGNENQHSDDGVLATDSNPSQTDDADRIGAIKTDLNGEVTPEIADDVSNLTEEFTEEPIETSIDTGVGQASDAALATAGMRPIGTMQAAAGDAAEQIATVQTQIENAEDVELNASEDIRASNNAIETDNGQAGSLIADLNSQQVQQGGQAGDVIAGSADGDNDIEVERVENASASEQLIDSNASIEPGPDLDSAASLSTEPSPITEPQQSDGIATPSETAVESNAISGTVAVGDTLAGSLPGPIATPGDDTDTTQAVPTDADLQAAAAEVETASTGDDTEQGSPSRPLVSISETGGGNASESEEFPILRLVIVIAGVISIMGPLTWWMYRRWQQSETEFDELPAAAVTTSAQVDDHGLPASSGGQISTPSGLDEHDSELSESTDLPEDRPEVSPREDQAEITENTDVMDFGSARDSEHPQSSADPASTSASDEYDDERSTQMEADDEQKPDLDATWDTDETIDESNRRSSQASDESVRREQYVGLPEKEQEIANKLELAYAYQEMGKIEGAIEILREVVSEGNESQVQEARESLARLVDDDW